MYLAGITVASLLFPFTALTCMKLSFSGSVTQQWHILWINTLNLIFSPTRK